MKVVDELKKILADADAKIQKVIQPMVQSGSDTLVELGNKTIRTIHTPIKNLIIRLDQDWTQEEKKAYLQSYQDGSRDPLSGKKTKEADKKEGE